MSGRWLEYRRLSPDEVSELELTAARLAGEGATMMQIRKLELRHGAIAMVVGVTAEPCEQMTHETRWLRPDAQTLLVPGLNSFNRLFTAKEAYYLEQLYRTDHEISIADLAVMQGKAVPVAMPG